MHIKMNRLLRLQVSFMLDLLRMGYIFLFLLFMGTILTTFLLLVYQRNLDKK